MTESTLRDVVDRHKALGNPVRLRILRLLCGGPLYVCEIATILELAPSTVSEHLSCLRRCGLVDERKEGRWVQFHQTLTPEMVRELGEIRPAEGNAFAERVLPRLRERHPASRECGTDEATSDSARMRRKGRGE